MAESSGNAAPNAAGGYLNDNMPASRRQRSNVS